MVNLRVLIGFLAGALLAATGSYWLEHRHTAAEPLVATATVPAAVPPIASIPPVVPDVASPPPAEIVAPPLRLARKPVSRVIKRVAAPKLPRYAVRSPSDSPIAVPLMPIQELAQPPEIAVAPTLAEVPVEIRRDPEPVEAPVAESKPEAPSPHSVTIADGTMLRVRLGDALSTKRNRVGDTFTGTLDQELVVDGFVIAERGSRVEGRVALSEEAGRTRGLAHLGLELTRIHTSDGQTVNVRTARFEQLGAPSKTEDWAKIGMGTALGGAIGAAAGGGKGAAIGAAAGAAAGAGTVAATRGKPAEIAVETRIGFKLEQPVMLTERLP
jgi:hypothetical protein